MTALTVMIMGLEITSPPIGRDTIVGLEVMINHCLEITSPPIGRDTRNRSEFQVKQLVSKLPPHQ